MIITHRNPRPFLPLSAEIGRELRALKNPVPPTFFQPELVVQEWTEKNPEPVNDLITPIQVTVEVEKSAA